MSRDSQCLYSTPIDIPGTLRSSQQFSDCLNCALTYVAQEVAERLQRSAPFPVNSNNLNASIMPTLTTGNTNAPTIMIGEKAADSIKAANRSRQVPLAISSSYELAQRSY